MITVFAMIHILIGFALILFVLLQDPKGGAMGVFSGGSSANSFFGSSGASNFLTSTTKWLAILFGVSCIGLTYLTAQKGTSVMDDYTAPAATSAPATPDAAQPAAEPPATEPVKTEQNKTNP